MLAGIHYDSNLFQLRYQANPNTYDQRRPNRCSYGHQIHQRRAGISQVSIIAPDWILYYRIVSN